mmetsp:Transcript_127838/g.246334  ORF Transcript_127838/g.246334 Transcript_127838/m.246334 type:complete len:207 (+) Transcript_127838:256-876(+)
MPGMPYGKVSQLKILAKLYGLRYPRVWFWQCLSMPLFSWRGRSTQPPLSCFWSDCHGLRAERLQRGLAKNCGGPPRCLRCRWRPAPLRLDAKQWSVAGLPRCSHELCFLASLACKLRAVPLHPAASWRRPAAHPSAPRYACARSRNPSGKSHCWPHALCKAPANFHSVVVCQNSDLSAASEGKLDTGASNSSGALPLRHCCLASDS